MTEEELEQIIEKARSNRFSRLCLVNCQLSSLPESIGNLSNLIELDLTNNQLTSLPKWIGNMSNLIYLNLNGNPLRDLSTLQPLTELYDDSVEFIDIYLRRKYWTKFSDWKSEWLLEEDNVEIRRMLIQEVGYPKICRELNAIELDRWREYTLLEIANIERLYQSEGDDTEILESIVLLKMICPSTGHIHILRVPPEINNAEAAITWVNHGIHPDEFAMQT